MVIYSFSGLLPIPILMSCLLARVIGSFWCYSWSQSEFIQLAKTMFVDLLHSVNSLRNNTPEQHDTGGELSAKCLNKEKEKQLSVKLANVMSSHCTEFLYNRWPH